MKKLFAGLLVGTMVMAGTGTVFAATQGQESSPATKIVELAKTGDAKGLNMVKLDTVDAKGSNMMKLDTIEAITIQDLAGEQKAEEGLMMSVSIQAEDAVELTPEQKAEMEKAQKAFEARLKEVCEEVGYDYETIITKLEKGTVTDEELKVLNEVGITLAVSTQPAEMIQIENNQEIIPMTKIVEK